MMCLSTTLGTAYRFVLIIFHRQVTIVRTVVYQSKRVDQFEPIILRVLPTKCRNLMPLEHENAQKQSDTTILRDK